MAQLALGAAGAFIGSFFGAPLIGFSIGAAIGASLFPPKTQGPRLTDLGIQGSQYGGMVPICFGTVRMAGMVRWATKLKEHAHKGGKGGAPTQYTYTCSFAVRFNDTKATGPAIGLLRLWADGRLIYDASQENNPNIPKLPMTIYLGESDQGVDPTIESVLGVGNVPAYRQTAGLVFTDMDMSPFYNRIPNLEGEWHCTGKPITLSVYSIWDVWSSTHLFDVGVEHTSSGIVTHRYTRHFPADGIIVYEEAEYTIDGLLLAGPTTTNIDTTLATGTDVLRSINSGHAYSWGQRTFDGSAYGKGIVYANSFRWLYNGAETYIPKAPLPEKDFFCINATKISGTWQYAYQLPIDSQPMAYGGNVYAAGRASDGYRIRRWPATEGPVVTDAWDIKGPDADDYSSLPTDAESVIVLGDDGYIYWLVTYSTGGGDGERLVKLDAGLNQITIWDSHTSPMIPSAGTRSFTIYHGYLIANYQTIPSYTHPNFSLSKLVEDGSAITFLQYIPVIGTTETPVITLHNGYAAVQDGILFLGGGPCTRGSIVQSISELCGLDDAQIDVSQLDDIVDGYKIANQSTGRANIEPLMLLAPPFDAVESDAKVKFPLRSGVPLLTIDDTDLGAHAAGTQAIPLIETAHGNETTLPAYVNVDYLNVNADYQINSQVAQRQITSSQLRNLITLAVVMDDTRASATAWGWLFNSWLERDHFTFTTARKYAYLDPTDVVTVHGHTVRLLQRDEQVDGVVKWEAVPTRADIFVQASVSGPPLGFVPPVVTAIADSTALLLDIPLINDSDYPNGFYAAIYGSPAGSTLFKSSDGGTSYDAGVDDAIQQLTGITNTALGDFSDGNNFDESNVVQVQVQPTGDTLSSVTEDAVLNGANEFLIGNEIIQPKTCTFLSTGIYNLSGMLRGRRGTEWATNTHFVGERFVSFAPTLLNVQGPLNEINAIRTYKAVTQGKTLADATAQTFTNAGVALRPYAPINLGGGPDGSGNVTLNWTRRTRIGGVWIDLVDVPLGEAQEKYIVQIWDVSYRICARIITVSNAQTVVYTSAQQTTDFGGQQLTIYFSVGQVGSVSLGSQAYGSCLGSGASNVAPLAPIAPYAFPSVYGPPPNTTRTPDYTYISFASPNEEQQVVVTPLPTGSTWSGVFTTPNGAFVGNYGAFPYGTGVTGERHMWVSTDSGGASKVAGSDTYGFFPLMFVNSTNTPNITLALNTTYYLFFDFTAPNGTIPLGIGADGSSIINLTL